MIVIIEGVTKRYDSELKKLGFEFIRGFDYYELATDWVSFEHIKPTINFLGLNYNVLEDVDDMYMVPSFRIYIYGATPLIDYLAHMIPHTNLKKDVIIIQTFSESDLENKTKKVIDIIRNSCYTICKINHKKDVTLIYVEIL